MVKINGSKLLIQFCNWLHWIQICMSLVYKGEIQIICIKFTRKNEPLFCFLDVTKKREKKKNKRWGGGMDYFRDPGV